MQVRAMVFAPNEVTPAGFMYIVHRGQALYAGRVHSSGKAWGEDIILSSERLRHKYCARAINYLEVLMVSRRLLLELCDRFPASAVAIRKCAIRLALCREVVA